jgi:hypothetical protein
MATEKDIVEMSEKLLSLLDKTLSEWQHAGAAAFAEGRFDDARRLLTRIEEGRSVSAEFRNVHSRLEALIQDRTAGRPTTDATALAEEPRKQDRTEPVILNARRRQILETLEKRLGSKLERQTPATYSNERKDIHVVCTISKWYATNGMYWYAYHPHQDKFLNKARDAYFVLGLLDTDVAIMLPHRVIRENLDHLNQTKTPQGREYWHVHISRSRFGGFQLHRARGKEPLPLDNYIVKLGSGVRGH